MKSVISSQMLEGLIRSPVKLTERLLLILNSFWDQFPNPRPNNFAKTSRSWSNTTLQYMICISMPEPSYRYSYASQTSKSLLFAYRNSSTPINSPNEMALGNLWRTLQGIQLLANYNKIKLNSVRYHWKCHRVCEYLTSAVVTSISTHAQSETYRWGLDTSSLPVTFCPAAFSSRL